MTVTTTKLTRVYKLFAQVSLYVGPVKLNKMEPFHLGHVFLVLIWVELFVLLCEKKVMWICHLIKQIFHSSSKNRSDMARGGISLHILLAVVEYLLNIILYYIILYYIILYYIILYYIILYYIMA